MRRFRAYAETPPANVQRGGIQGTRRILRNCVFYGSPCLSSWNRTARDAPVAPAEAGPVVSETLKARSFCIAGLKALQHKRSERCKDSQFHECSILLLNYFLFSFLENEK